jgi:hypothetical protein
VKFLQPHREERFEGEHLGEAAKVEDGSLDVLVLDRYLITLLELGWSWGGEMDRGAVAATTTANAQSPQPR